MKPSEIINLAAIILGPLIGVGITLLADRLKRRRESEEAVLRTLMVTRLTPGDPQFTMAMNIVPVVFSKYRTVMEAWRNYISATASQVSPENEDQMVRQANIRMAKLLFAMMRRLRYNVTEADILNETYFAKGFADRDELQADSLRAMRDIANQLKRSADLTERVVTGGAVHGASTPPPA